MLFRGVQVVEWFPFLPPPLRQRALVNCSSPHARFVRYRMNVHHRASLHSPLLSLSVSLSSNTSRAMTPIGSAKIAVDDSQRQLSSPSVESQVWPRRSAALMLNGAALEAAAVAVSTCGAPRCHQRSRIPLVNPSPQRHPSAMAPSAFAVKPHPMLPPDQVEALLHGSPCASLRIKGTSGRTHAPTPLRIGCPRAAPPPTAEGSAYVPSPPSPRKGPIPSREGARAAHPFRGPRTTPAEHTSPPLRVACLRREEVDNSCE